MRAWRGTIKKSAKKNAHCRYLVANGNRWDYDISPRGITKLKPTFATLPLQESLCFLDDDGNEVLGNGVSGNLCIKNPWPSMAEPSTEIMTATEKLLFSLPWILLHWRRLPSGQMVLQDYRKSR